MAIDLEGLKRRKTKCFTDSKITELIACVEQAKKLIEHGADQDDYDYLPCQKWLNQYFPKDKEGTK